MQTAAVICEFNPFHNGHKYIIDQAKKITGADYVMAVMSGNFVQRGEPAVMNKFLRAGAALRCGADIVVEIPPFFSTASAADFAGAGVSIASASGIADFLVFGAEKADINELSDIAEILLETETDKSSELSEKYSLLLKTGLSSGMSYPAARENALRNLGFKNARLISSPNNILACEYLRAVKSLEASGNPKYKKLRPVAVKRIGDSFLAESPSDSSFTSATAIRNILFSYSHDSSKALCREALRGEASVSELRERLSPYLPKEILELYTDHVFESGSNFEPLISKDRLSDMLNLKLLELMDEDADFTDYCDVSQTLSQRIKKTALRPMTFSDRIETLKTKDYTYSRISRALLHIVLGMRSSEMKELKAHGYTDHIRLLGFRRSSSALLKELKNNSSLPIVTKAADNKELLKHSLKADNIYYSLLAGKNKYIKNEFEREIVTEP